MRSLQTDRTQYDIEREALYAKRVPTECRACGVIYDQGVLDKENYHPKTECLQNQIDTLRKDLALIYESVTGNEYV